MSGKAIAGRNANDEPICGECKNVVNANSTICTSCGADLYTRLGMGVRRVIFGLGVVAAFLGLVFALDGGASLILGAVFFVVGGVLLYAWRDMVRTAPNRDIRLRERFPI
ncbi:phage holin family protein [Halobacteria archaeon AArc-curdl1]|uniref:Phage holin family protein n=1 Tax=Natronosalvus hydrolyticus TaxID=2979988 RepID=A0AAP2Z5Q6_9EURY|nr:phage holin family protein [Halobacteria archaeon AArc-curdl1]